MILAFLAGMVFGAIGLALVAIVIMGDEERGD